MQPEPVANESKFLSPGFSQGVWPLKERLILASIVCNQDNQQVTWTLVQKRMSRFTPPGRDLSWCSAKNCSKQYAAMLDCAEIAQREIISKLKTDANHPDSIFLGISSSDFLMRKLVIQRLDEVRDELRHNIARNSFLKDIRELIRTDKLTVDQMKEMLSLLKIGQRTNSSTLEYTYSINKLESILLLLLNFSPEDQCPPDSWTTNFRRNGNFPLNASLSGATRHSGGPTGNVASLLSAASARKLPSALATSSQPESFKKPALSPGQKRPPGRPPKIPRDTIYKTAAKVEPKQRNSLLGPREHASINVYVEPDENPIEETSTSASLNETQ
ncbi:Bromodomain-containing protein 8 [Cichlidogyrus casuarinus]|uniref:Bromodomain-containing protein 8 n=1 Tax=Cichlidogyrus casuarinus TaxID=1844966 RepID=A0ABD2QGB9_9PLAT